MNADHDSTALDSQENIPQDAMESLSEWYDERDRLQDLHDAEERDWAEQDELQRLTDG